MNEPRVKQLYIDKIPPYYIGEVDWLMYRSYEHNRDRSPEIEPERWRKIYYNQEIYERIYQARGNHVS